MRVTCGIPTKNRYDTLVLTLLSVAFQTFKEIDVIIVDDSDSPVDLRELPQYRAVLQLFDTYGIGWQVQFGRKLGQHHSHQMIQDMAGTEWIWRIDDDEVAEPNVLNSLFHVAVTRDNVGAVGGLVLPPSPGSLPDSAASTIENLDTPNIQWFRHPTPRITEVDHLHSTFLYRSGQETFNLGLSCAAHREETLFTYGLKRKGYSVLVDPWVVTWHFPADKGGIRSYQDPKLWEDDEKLFQDKLAEWGVNRECCKNIVLDCGKGDHVVVKKLIPELKKKYGKLILATCFPDVFADDDVEQISIAEAKQRLGNIDRYNVYRWMIDHAWNKPLEGAFREMYAL